MNNDNDILPGELELIESYLMNNMAVPQREQFAQRLQVDASLNKKVSEIKNIIYGIEQAVQTEKVTQWHTKMISDENDERPLAISSTSFIIKYKAWLIAATILFFVAGIWSVFFAKSKEEQLYAKYYKPDYGLITPMSATDNYMFNKAMIDYKSGKYEPAIIEWQLQLAQRPDSDTLNYFIGSAYMAQQDYKQAVSYFKKTAAIAGSEFIGDSNWYLGLSLLQLGFKQEAVLYIQKSNHLKKEILLRELIP